LHTEASLGWGGQEIRTLTEAAGFIARGHRIVVYAAPDSRILAEAPRYGVPRSRCRSRRSSRAASRRCVGAFPRESRRHRQRPQLHRHVARRARLPLAAGAQPPAPVLDPHAHVSIPVPHNRATRWLYQRATRAS
jgi:hypothetical protein